MPASRRLCLPWLTWGALAGASAIACAGGCGGNTATLPARPSDAGTANDAADGWTTSDATDAAEANDAADGSDASDANDASDADDAADAMAGDGGAPCSSPTPVACVDPSTGANDFCSNGAACSACSDGTDDGNCTTAYGGSASPYLCLAGACSPGDCRANADCASNSNGPLCGIATPNFCGKCTADLQCASTSATPVCNTTTGRCVAGTCIASATNPPAACPVNASDVCCTGVCQVGGGAHSCCPGAGANAYCAGILGNSHATCVGNTCTACPPVTGTNVEVDPVNGSDQTGTGDSTTAGCAFKTITRALQVIGSAPVATTVTVRGPSTVNAGEAFPIIIPSLVTVTTSSGAVVVNVPAGKSGFTLSSPNSGMSGASGALLTVSGQSHVATFGIVATTGSQSSTRIANLTVTGYLDDGILVEGTGVLSIGAGVTSTLNGTATARKAGLHVTGAGEAIVTVPSGSAPTHFDANTNHGILVDTNGFVDVSGAVTSPSAGTGTITTNANYAAGIWIQQTPGTPPQNVITGVVSFGSTNGNGMRFVTGSNVKLRSSASLGNQASGIIVSNTAGNSDITKIDLGNPTGPAYGNNTLQLTGASKNGSAGLCMTVRANSGRLLAAGNVFRSANCAASASVLTINKASCANAACTGAICDVAVTGAGNDVNASMCTHP